MSERLSLEEIFAEPAGAQTQGVGNNRPSLEEIFAEPVSQPGLMDNFRGRGEELNNIVNSNQSMPSKIYQGAVNSAAGPINDTAGALAKMANSGLRAWGNAVSNAPTARPGGFDPHNMPVIGGMVGPSRSGLAELGGSMRENQQAFNNEYPEAAANLRATGELGSALLNFLPMSKIPGAALDVGRNTMQAAKGMITPKQLPQELAPLESLVSATKPTMFASKPNAIEQGMKANQEVSRAYDLAKENTYQANLAAREAGNTPIPAEDVYKRLNKITASLEGKVAPGTKEAGALDQLNAIKMSLNDKNPKIVSTAGEKVGERTILPSDLMDIEKAINAGLSKNKFITSGEGKSLNFKKTVQEALDRAGEQNPDFKQKYKDYKSAATNQMKTFDKNDSLKPFWQPEDHIAWKANQNNPVQQPFADTTLNRMNNTLDNLNTSQLGNIKAVINALPKKQADELMRSAYVKAKKEQINFTNALLNLAVGRVPTALATAGKALVGNKGAVADLTDAAQNLKKLRVPGKKKSSP